ncbi:MULTISPECIES: symmetrical bis(5'-nucleosyl)-tetraphosphatase [Methylotenera]|uniref:symmetrical bis(5'-nucleosyl)-tetraphosphatase n=1 Tax=Methylotenera TaxID=359407 RepID=UPI00037F8949|nr:MULTISPECIES: symmetrical bis(5'-nucleosyl)-tetraphosphatase [Methylotenera]
MATYAIGDIQGCYHAFSALLNRLQFNPKTDQLRLVGDLINRGSGSLEVLRWCVQHQSCVKLVLGNHDLHAIAVAHQLKKAHKSDTLQAIIDAPDCDELLTWLRHQPLMLVDFDTHQQSYAIVHAGLLPQWTIQQAVTYAHEVQMALQAFNYRDFLTHMYGNTPNIWQDDFVGMDRLRVITNAMTRMRICKANGEMEFAFKGELQNVPEGYMPWFNVPNRQSQATRIFCGHWSALGLSQRNNVISLDTGCLWGGQLTAFCIETGVITQVQHDVRDLVAKPI